MFIAFTTINTSLILTNVCRHNLKIWSFFVAAIPGKSKARKNRTPRRWPRRRATFPEISIPGNRRHGPELAASDARKRHAMAARGDAKKRHRRRRR